MQVAAAASAPVGSDGFLNGSSHKVTWMGWFAKFAVIFGVSILLVDLVVGTVGHYCVVQGGEISKFLFL